MKKLTVSNLIVCIVAGIIINVGLVNLMLLATVECGFLPKSFPVNPVGIIITLIIVILIATKSDVFSEES